GNVAVWLGLIAVLDDDVGHERAERRAVDDEVEASVERASLELAREDAERRAKAAVAAAPDGVVAEAVSEEERPVLLVEIFGHRRIGAVRQVVRFARYRSADGNAEVVRLVGRRQAPAPAGPAPARRSGRAR